MASVSIVYPAQEVATVSEFLVERGFTQRFADGTKFAMLELDGLRVMVVAGGDRIVEHPSLAFQIDADAAGLLKQHPHAVVAEGDHEHNIVIKDPSGNSVVFFVRKPKEEEQ